MADLFPIDRLRSAAFAPPDLCRHARVSGRCGSAHAGFADEATATSRRMDLDQVERKRVRGDNTHFYQESFGALTIMGAGLPITGIILVNWHRPHSTNMGIDGTARNAARTPSRPCIGHPPGSVRVSKRISAPRAGAPFPQARRQQRTMVLREVSDPHP